MLVTCYGEVSKFLGILEFRFSLQTMAIGVNGDKGWIPTSWSGSLWRHPFKHIMTSLTSRTDIVSFIHSIDWRYLCRLHECDVTLIVTSALPTRCVEMSEFCTYSTCPDGLHVASNSSTSYRHVTKVTGHCCLGMWLLFPATISWLDKYWESHCLRCKCWMHANAHIAVVGIVVDMLKYLRKKNAFLWLLYSANIFSEVSTCFCLDWTMGTIVTVFGGRLIQRCVSALWDAMLYHHFSTPAVLHACCCSKFVGSIYDEFVELKRRFNFKEKFAV